MQAQMKQVLDQVQKVIRGKQDVIEKVLMALLADGHILLDDVPGIGKTTLAVALGRALGLTYNRVQFTPDVLPSDIVGFSLYEKERGTFVYMPGVVTRTNLLLVDEINRTSSKTQSALLEAMAERQVTVDGAHHPLETPFLVIATENHVGTAGTQLLPHAQLDRFLVRLTLGYPDFESEMALIRDRQTEDPMDHVAEALSRNELLWLQRETREVSMSDEIVAYITRLAVATRESELTELGISPRGALSLSRMARACAFLRGRDYVLPQDVQEVFSDVCAHRILLSQKARSEGQRETAVLAGLLRETKLPFSR